MNSVHKSVLYIMYILFHSFDCLDLCVEVKQLYIHKVWIEISNNKIVFEGESK